jgi:hypothetical protein
MKYIDYQDYIGRGTETEKKNVQIVVAYWADVLDFVTADQFRQLLTARRLERSPK